MIDVLLAVLLLSLGVALAECERWLDARPSARGVERVVLALLVSAAVVVLLVAGVVRIVQSATVGVWELYLPAGAWTYHDVDDALPPLATPALMDEVAA